MYGLCCPLPVKLQTPQDDSAMWLGVLLRHSLTFDDVDDDDVDDDDDDPGWGRKRVYEAPNQLSQYPT